MTLIKAIKKCFTGKILSYLCQFMLLMIYARIFTPEEFGVLATIQIILVFFHLIADSGIGPALINEKNLKRKDINGVFTFTFLIAIVLSTFFYFSSELISLAFNYEYHSLVIPFVAISIFFYTINVVPITTFNRELKFVELSVIEIISEIIAFVSILYLLQKIDPVLALLSRTLINAIFRFLIVWFLSKFNELGRPIFGGNIFFVKKIYKFALYQFGFNFVNYFSRNADKIAVGNVFGLISLSFYEKAYQLMQYPIQLTTYAITPAIQPVLTKIADKHKVLTQHNNIVMYIFFIGMHFSIFILFNSKSIVLLVFGSKWLEVIPLIEVFCLFIPLQSILSTSGAFFQTIGKVKLLFISGLISFIFNIIAVIIGVISKSLELMVWVLLISFTLNFIQTYYIMFKFGFKEGTLGFCFVIIKVLVIITPLNLVYSLFSKAGIFHVGNYINEFIINSFIYFFVFSVNFITLKKYTQLRGEEKLE